MAELEQSCCSPQTQATCCEPFDKAACCGPAHEDGCGCAASTSEGVDIREVVREKYAAYVVATPGTVASPGDREEPSARRCTTAASAATGCAVCYGDIGGAWCSSFP